LLHTAISDFFRLQQIRAQRSFWARLATLSVTPGRITARRAGKAPIFWKKRENIQYRKHDDMPDYQSEEIIAKILDQIERRVELESLFPSSPIQEFSVGPKKIYGYSDIENVAQKIREKWNLGLEPISNLIDTFEENGSLV